MDAVVFDATVRQAVRRHLGKVTQAVAYRCRGNRIAKHVAATGRRVGQEANLRRAAKDAREPIDTDDIHHRAPTQGIAAKTEAAVITDLMCIVKAVNGSVVWRADHQVTRKAAPATQAERDGQRAPCWVESLRQSRNRVAGAIRVVVIVLVAKADRMREAARSRIQSERDLVGVVLVGKRRKLDAAQTFAGNARIRIVGKAKEGAERAGQVPIQPPQRHLFVVGKRPGAGELWKARNVGGHGSVLIIAFVAHEPEQAITDEGTTEAEAGLLAVEGSRLLSDARSERVISPKEESTAVHFVGPALGHDVDGTTASQTGGNIRGGAANLIFLDGIRGNVLRHRAEVFVADI